MSIRKIGNRWQVRLRIGGGRRVERTLPPTAKRADAVLLEANLRAAQVDAVVGRKPRYLIQDAIDRWVDSEAQHLKSWRAELQYRVRILRAVTAGYYLEDLPDVADRVKRTGQKEGTKAATINRLLALLRRLGNLAERWGWTDKPIGRRVQLLPERSERHVYLTIAQVKTLAKHARKPVDDIILFAALTGLRRGELLSLKPGQVQDGIIALTAATKSGRPRGIPITPEAQQIAKRLLPIVMSEHALWEAFKAAREKANLEHVRFHDLRHTYASWLVQAGKPLTAVRDLLGHSSLLVTNRYSHLAPAHLVDAVSALPQLGKRVGKIPRGAPKKKAA
jgi:integrase